MEDYEELLSESEYYDELFDEEDIVLEQEDQYFQAEKLFHHYSVQFSRSCFNHDDYSFASFHMLLGSMPNIRKIRIKKGTSLLDPRVHIFYIAASGSGKGAGSNFINRVAKELDLIIHQCGAITSNALTGTIVENKDKESDEQYKFSDGYLNPIAMPSNIVEFTEAAELITIRPPLDMKKCLDHFQKAMNPLGTDDNRITKKIGFGDELSFNPDASLFFTTYKPVELAEVVTQRGFLQRCMFIIRDVDFDQRFEDIESVIEGLDTDKTDFSLFIPHLRDINRFYEEVDHLTIAPGVKEIAVKHILMFRKPLLNCNTYIQERLIDFIPRFMDLYWKIAMHSCFIRKDTTIRQDDVFYAHHMLHERFLRTLSYLQENIPVPQEYVIRQRNTFNSVHRLYSAAKKQQNKSWFTIDSVKRVLAKEKIFMREKDASEYLYRLARAKIIEVKDGKMRFVRGLADGEVY